MSSCFGQVKSQKQLNTVFILFTTAHNTVKGGWILKFKAYSLPPNSQLSLLLVCVALKGIEIRDKEP